MSGWGVVFYTVALITFATVIGNHIDGMLEDRHVVINQAISEATK